MSSICLASDIFALNASKEYTLTATYLLESILKNSALCGHAAKLWQILFNKGRFNKDLSVQISYKELGESLNKSPRTIIRYVKSLEECGYLIVNKRFYKNGGRTTNLLKIRAPLAVIKNAQKQKNRLSTQPQSEITFQTNAAKLPFLTRPPHDKCDTEGYDTFVITNNNIKTDNNNNSSSHENPSHDSVVVSAQISTISNDSTVTQLSEHLKCLKNKTDTLQQAWLSESDNSKKAQKFLQLREMEAAIESLQIHLEQQQQIVNRVTNSTEPNQLMDNNRFCPNRISHQRAITSTQALKIRQALAKIGIEGSYGTRLTNEIIYEARFGSLARNNITHTENSLERAINIALKLVREKGGQVQLDYHLRRLMGEQLAE